MLRGLGVQGVRVSGLKGFKNCYGLGCKGFR